MLSLIKLVFSACLAVSWGAEELTFPSGFKFGVASAAYQVEGAWNVSDKSESIWDRFTHNTPSPVTDGSNGDVACDSYHLWQEDVKMVAELGAHFYRLSISWPRLLPGGSVDHISEDGKHYYNRIIDGLLEKGIEPVITLYHYDLPQNLQDLGGWANPLVVDWFTDYAREVYSIYGDRVKTWITINDPWTVCDVPYMTGMFAPGVTSLVGAYICTKNVLMAHAKAWRLYDEEFRSKYNGKVSLAQHAVWMEAADETEEAGAQLMREYQEGRFSHAIFSAEGGWPPAVEKALAEFSRKAAFPWNVLPKLTEKEIEFIKGTYDFYALNFYNSKLVRKGNEGDVFAPWPVGDVQIFNTKLGIHPDWLANTTYYNVYPEGIRKQLAWLKQQYGDIPVLVTGSVRGSHGGRDDQDRVDYFKNYLKQVLLSIKEDGVNVTGYTAWALMDAFEWSEGYKSKFGLYEVDFSSPQRTRTPRATATFYASVIKSNSLDVTYNFTTNVAPKTSNPQDSNTNAIIFGGLVLVIIIVIIAVLIRCRTKRRAQAEEHRYSAVNNGTQNGFHGDAQLGGHNGAQNGNRNVTDNHVEELIIRPTN